VDDAQRTGSERKKGGSMKTQKVEVTTPNTGLAAFMVTFQDLSPFKITTDATGAPEFFFKVSSLENWEKYQSQYSTEPIVDAATFYADIVQLQSRARETHRKGGVWRAT
jgi:hypothetical protein